MLLLEHLPILQVAFILLSAILIIFFNHKSALSIITLLMLCLLVSSILIHYTTIENSNIFYAIGGWSSPWGIEYRIDAINSFIILLIAITALFICIYSRNIIDIEIAPKAQPFYWACFMLSIASALGIVSTGDLFNIFVFLEINSLANCIMISMGRNKKALVAAYKYLIISTIGATFYIIGVGFLYMISGALDISHIIIILPKITQERILIVSFIFIFTGLLLKIAIFPLYHWVAPAYTYSPSLTSILLSAISTKLILYILIKIVFIYSNNDMQLFASWHNFVIILAILSIFICSIKAIFVDNIKALLAYSSLSQIGYIMLGIGINNSDSITASLVYMINHGIAKMGLFMCVIIFGLKSQSFCLDKMHGIGRKMPFLSIITFITMMSIVGIPFTGGFISKWYMLVSLIKENMLITAFLITVSTILTIIYMGKIFIIIYHKTPIENNNNILSVHYSSYVILVLISILIFYLGLDSTYYYIIQKAVSINYIL